MNEMTSAGLFDAVSSALERTAFLMVDPVEERGPYVAPTSMQHARICYSGPVSGAVWLAATDGFLLELASSLLGVEPDEVSVDVEGQDALRELTNIVGGSILLELGGDDSPFLLGLPEIIDYQDHDAGSVVTCNFDSEGERLSVSWVPDVAKAAA